MNDASLSVDLLPLNRLDDVVDVYTEAFAGYPVMRVTVGDEGDIAARERRLIQLFVTRRTRRGGPMYGVQGSKTSKTSKTSETSRGSKLAGAILLTLPVEPDPPPEVAEISAAAWRELGEDARLRYEAYTEAANRMAIREPHHHLNMIGVRPAHKGSGLGRRLLEFVRGLAEADPQSAGVSLATENPRNVELYRHFGTKSPGTRGWLPSTPLRASPVSRPGGCSSGLDRMVRFHMLNFDLTEEQRLLEQTVRDWGAREVQPHIRELDRAHKFDPKVFPQMAKLGLLGCSVPEEYGGAGMDYLSLGIISEELEYVDTSLRVIMSVHAGLNCLTLLSWGTEEQKQRYLVPQAKGEQIATYGLTEPAAGSDARGIQTVAIKKGDRYHLTGEKMWISLADVADNFIVFAWTDLEKKKKKDPSGLSAFIVERRFKGFSSGTLKEKWGILAGNTGFFKMEEMEVPAGNLLGREGEGFKIAMFALDQGRYTVAAGATGLIRACRDASAKYAKDRKAFGVEIGQHQLVKQMIANMESDYQNSRLLWMRAGWMKNIGRRNTRETGLAKWFATVASERSAGDAVQVHGANGYSDEYPVGRFYRNCKGAVIYEGTREIHTLMQADYVLGYRQDKPTRCELPAYLPAEAEPAKAGAAASDAAPAASGKR